MARKWHESGPIFHVPQAKNQSASWHRVYWFPSKPPQIMHGTYQDHLWWLRSNGLAVLSVGLMNYGQKMAWIRLNFPLFSSKYLTNYLKHVAYFFSVFFLILKILTGSAKILDPYFPAVFLNHLISHPCTLNLMFDRWEAFPMFRSWLLGCCLWEFGQDCQTPSQENPQINKTWDKPLVCPSHCPSMTPSSILWPNNQCLLDERRFQS
jgi:hypothetical protein